MLLMLALGLVGRSPHETLTCVAGVGAVGLSLNRHLRRFFAAPRECCQCLGRLYDVPIPPLGDIFEGQAR